MSPEPQPLASGTLLVDRFELQETLGRGGFGIAYRGFDRGRGDAVVVKELAPHGLRREPDGMIHLEGAKGHRLRERFLDEAKVLRRVKHPGVPAFRAAFVENGTAYYVTDDLPGSHTLEQVLERQGRLDADEALRIFQELLATLEHVHRLGILHRDLKPSNVLLSPSGDVRLIDFGAAREWAVDASLTHTVMHTPGYAPPEQLSEKAERGPATDLYGLCATIYRSLAGTPPSTANDRLAGVPLIDILEIRPDLGVGFARALSEGLRLTYAERPPDAAAMRSILEETPSEAEPSDIEAMDETLMRLQAFRFDRRACPSCSGLLEEARPLRPGTCPVCANGVVRSRRIEVRKCPACRPGVLQRIANTDPLGICPACRFGRLTYRRKGLLGSERIATCASCSVAFEVAGARMRRTDTEEEHSGDEWRERSGRSAEVWACDDCETQLDLERDGRWRLARPAAVQGHDRLYPDEWARVALGLPPGAGNAECDTCGADFYLEEDRLTLLDVSADADGFAGRYIGRALDRDSVRWLGVGKSSGQAGPVCRACDTEFDRDGEYLRLVASPHRRLVRHIGQPRTLADWHRIGQRLPMVDEEPAFVEGVSTAIRDGYRAGSIGFDPENEILWRGRAVREGDDKSATLTVTRAEVLFGGLLRKWRVPFDAVIAADAREDRLSLRLSGHVEEEVFGLEAMALIVHLRSGDRHVTLTAGDLAVRIRAERSLK